MKQILGILLSRYIPVLNPENPSLAQTILRLIWNTGLWSNQSLRLHWFAKFTIFCYLSTNLSQVATLVIDRHDSTRMFETFSILSFCVMGMLKLFNLYTNRKHWLFILSQVKILENDQLQSKHLNTEECDFEEDFAPGILAEYTRKYRLIMSILLMVYSATAIIFIATPFIEYVFSGDVSYYPHILPGWAPLDTIGFIGYFLTIIFETVAAVYCLFVHVAFDCMSVGVMMFICGQFALLRRNTENIAGRGQDYMLSEKRDAAAHLRIIESHATHTALCNVIKKLDSSLRGILGVYFLVATMTVCLVAVRLNSTDIRSSASPAILRMPRREAKHVSRFIVIGGGLLHLFICMWLYRWKQGLGLHAETLSAMQLVSLLQYMCGNLTQLFLFCRYGDAVLHESSFNMGEGPFGAAWWSLPPRVRRELAMLGAGMVPPRTLHAGPFNKLDLPSFVQIVRAAYSYYAVLQTSK